MSARAFDKEAFRAPPAAYRPVPMWFWNGDIQEEEVRHQVREAAGGGLGGLQIAARTGLQTPYLSERWLALVTAAADEAAAQGIETWLADEYPYPSGVSGGEVVLRHPEYRAWRLAAQTVRLAPGETVRRAAPGTALLCAQAVPVRRGQAQWRDAVDLAAHTGLVQHEPVYVDSGAHLSDRRFLAASPRPTLWWQAPAEPGVEAWEVWLVAAAEVERFKFFGSYVDLCNADAVRFFLESTHERYAARLGRAGMERLAGFFLDESNPPSWSWRLPAAFRARTGHDLAPLLPALWSEVGEGTAQVRYDYWQTLTELFVESFHQPVAAWCRGHGLRLCLEVGSTRNVVQRHADIPGIDPGHEKAGTPLDEILGRDLLSMRANLNFPASLAAQTGKERVLVEAFHSVGWSLTLQDMKAMLDRLAAQGATFFTFHAFSYTIGGLQKWDAPPSQFLQNPYWPHFRRLADYTGRLAYALTRGRRVAPVALLDPITSLWTHGGPPGPGRNVGAPRDAAGERIAADWHYLMRELLAAQRPFDSLDPLLLAEARVDGPTLRLGEAVYRAVVLPPLLSLEAAAWEKLETFADAGGTVIACGLLPYESIEPGGDVPARCATRFGADTAALRRVYEGQPGVPVETPAAEPRADSPRSPASQGGFRLLRTQGTLRESAAAAALFGLLDAVAPPDLVVQPVDAPAARRSLLFTQRRDDAAGADLFFLANVAGEPQECDLVLRGASGDLSLLDLEEGGELPLETRESVAADGSATRRVRLRLGPHGARLLYSSGPGGAAPSARGPARAAVATAPYPAGAEVVDVPLEGEWEVTLDGDNALRLDRWRFWIEDDGKSGASSPPPAPEDAPLVDPKPLINVVENLTSAGRAAVAPVRVQPAFGAPARIHLALPRTLWYAATFTVDVVPPEAVLCLESGVLAGAWDLWVNGRRIVPDAFHPRFRWDIANVEAPVGNLLREGANEVVVRVAARAETDGLLGPLYVFGRFGVRAGLDGGWRLGGPPRVVRWRHLHCDGLPFYAGTYRVTRTMEVPARATERGTTLRLSDQELIFAGVARLTAGGHDLGVRPWAPFAWQAPPGTLRPGGNQVTLAVTNTLIGLLEGKRYDPDARRLVRLGTGAGETGLPGRQG